LLLCACRVRECGSRGVCMPVQRTCETEEEQGCASAGPEEEVGVRRPACLMKGVGPRDELGLRQGGGLC
jgi:hypothetical protein